MRQLLTTYYEETNPVRKQELDYCIKNNAASGLFDAIYIFTDSQVPLPVLLPKSIQPLQFNINRRTTYNDMFSLARQSFSDSNKLTVIANTDIFFDETLLLASAVDMSNTCFALSRWDIQEDNDPPIHHDFWDSQDVWIFQGKIRDINADFGIGVRGCDNRLAHELVQAGYNVYNPSKSIKAYHYHMSNYRTYEQLNNQPAPIPRPYHFVPSSYLKIGEVSVS